MYISSHSPFIFQVKRKKKQISTTKCYIFWIQLQLVVILHMQINVSMWHWSDISRYDRVILRGLLPIFIIKAVSVLYVYCQCWPDLVRQELPNCGNVAFLTTVLPFNFNFSPMMILSRGIYVFYFCNELMKVINSIIKMICLCIIDNNYLQLKEAANGE